MGINELNEDDNIEIDLLELAHELLMHWKTIVISVVLVAIVFGSYSKITYVPEYEASAEMYVFSKSTSITSMADIQIGTSLTNDYEYVITGRSILSKVIKNLGLNYTYEELKEHVTVENPEDTRVLKILVRDTDINKAKAIADEMVNVASAYVADNMDQAQPKIIQRAYAPKDAVNNRIMKNTAIGALIGLILAIAVVTVGFLLDDTVSNADEMEKRTGIKVLASLPLEDTVEYDGHKSKKHKFRKEK